MYTLVIVDMQPKFEAANNRRCIAACVREVRKAIENNATIIVLEYGRRGNESGHNTINSIRKLVKAYDKGVFLTKWHDDGSDEIYNYFTDILSVSGITEQYYDVKKFVVCGVNLGACVAATIAGLREYFGDAEIVVPKKAVNQPEDWNIRYDGEIDEYWLPENRLKKISSEFNVQIV